MSQVLDGLLVQCETGLAVSLFDILPFPGAIEFSNINHLVSS